jgi:hypothetical protein
LFIAIVPTSVAEVTTILIVGTPDVLILVLGVPPVRINVLLPEGVTVVLVLFLPLVRRRSLSSVGTLSGEVTRLATLVTSFRSTTSWPSVYLGIRTVSCHVTLLIAIEAGSASWRRSPLRPWWLFLHVVVLASF